MPRLLIATAALVALAALATCTQRNPSFCCETDEACAPFQSEQVPCDRGAQLVCDNDSNTCIPGTPCSESMPCADPMVCDTATGMCVECLAPGDCTAAEPVCENHACTLCRSDDDCMTFPDTPHCDLDGTRGCVECTGNDQCASGVCDAGVCQRCTKDSECSETGVCDEGTGACVAPGSILHVALNGTGDCINAPCGHFAEALARVNSTFRYILVAPGEYNEPPVMIGGKTVDIVGHGASVRVNGIDMSVISVTSGDVSIDGLRIFGSGGPSTPAGVSCTGTSPTSRTRLTLRDATVESNAGAGVATNQCDVVIERSVIRANAVVGLDILRSGFDVTNTFIVKNRGAASIGGVLITQPPAGATTRFAFNTVANNDYASSNDPAGVRCVGAVSTPFSSSIVYGNTSGAQQVDGTNCKWNHSLLQNVPPNTDGNIDGVPGFIDPNGNNFHLAATSPAREMADPAFPMTIDFDGDPRPLPAGQKPDCGADEVDAPLP